MFDALEARMNRAALKKLANALANFGGEDIPVIFDAEFKVGMAGVVGMGAAAPQLVMANDQVPTDVIDVTVLVNGKGWRVADRQPDSEQEYGLATLILERA
jgi:hypothetical protein